MRIWKVCFVNCRFILREHFGKKMWKRYFCVKVAPQFSVDILRHFFSPQWLLGVETLRGWIQSIVKPDLSVLKKVNVLPPQYSTRKTEKAVIFRFIDSRYCYSFHILQPHALTKRKWGVKYVKLHFRFGQIWLICYIRSCWIFLLAENQRNFNDVLRF